MWNTPQYFNCFLTGFVSNSNLPLPSHLSYSGHCQSRCFYSNPPVLLVNLFKLFDDFKASAERFNFFFCVDNDRNLCHAVHLVFELSFKPLQLLLGVQSVRLQLQFSALKRELLFLRLLLFCTQLLEL